MFERVRKESADVYRQFNTYDKDSSRSGNDLKFSILKLKEHPEMKIPLYYKLSGYTNIFGANVITRIDTVYGTPNDLTVDKMYEWTTPILWGIKIDGCKQAYWPNTGYDGEFSYDGTSGITS